LRIYIYDIVLTSGGSFKWSFSCLTSDPHKIDKIHEGPAKLSKRSTICTLFAQLLLDIIGSIGFPDLPFFRMAQFLMCEMSMPLLQARARESLPPTAMASN
jgi:hypothetical protein